MGYFKWADKQLQDLIAKNPTYTRSQYPGMQLGLAGQIAGSRMPGSSQYQQNVFTNQGNVLGVGERVATDASQALAFAAGTQGQTDQSLGDLQLMEADWKKFGLSNLNDAYGAMADEDRLVEQMKQERFQNEVSLKGAQANNKYAKRRALWDTVSGIANFGASVFTGGVDKFTSLLGGKGGGAGSGVSRNPGGGYTVSGRVR